MVESRERLHIAVGVILDQATDRVLVARRPGHLHLGGLLEFPGGKLHPGEHVTAALNRELQEELNINATMARQMIQIKHDYDEESVLLDVWLVSEWYGEPEGMEGQEIMWIQKDNLSKADFPDANWPIITAINLPPVYGITPELPVYGDEFFNRLKCKLENGLKLIQFRNKHMDNRAKYNVVKKTYEICCDYNCRLLVNGMSGMELFEFAHGLHLTSSDLLRLDDRPMGEDYLIAASCHNRTETDHACSLGVDFAVLSPVKKTPGHDKSEPIGWNGFADIVLDCNIPVYALGGMEMSDVDDARSFGGQGVALIRGLWDA